MLGEEHTNTVPLKMYQPTPWGTTKPTTALSGTAWAHQSLLVPIRDCRPYGEVKLGRAKWTFLTWQGKGLASTSMLGMRHSSSQPTHGAHPQVGFVQIVKALFWADSAEDRLHAIPPPWCHPTGPKAIPALPKPLCKHQKSNSQWDEKGTPKTEGQLGCPCPQNTAPVLCFCLLERKTCAGGGRQGEDC